MTVRMRLTRLGKKKSPTYRVVVVDGRAPRDGKYIEQIGRYDPHPNPSLIEIDMERALYWLSRGVQPSDRVKKLLEISGAWTQFLVSKGVVHVVEDRRPKPKTGEKSTQEASEELEGSKAAGGENAEVDSADGAQDTTSSSATPEAAMEVTETAAQTDSEVGDQPETVGEVDLNQPAEMADIAPNGTDGSAEKPPVESEPRDLEDEQPVAEQPETDDSPTVSDPRSEASFDFSDLTAANPESEEVVTAASSTADAASSVAETSSTEVDLGTADHQTQAAGSHDGSEEEMEVAADQDAAAEETEITGDGVAKQDKEEVDK